MKILIATPLFPPDVAKPALYLKELSRRLAEKHDVTVLLYGHLPEHVEGVSFKCVDKRRLAIARLPQYFFSLLRALRNADVLYVQNGASVELPMVLVSLLTHKRFILHIGDKASRERATHSVPLRYIETFAIKQAGEIVTDTPPPKPEILPFEDRSEEKLTEYNASWDTHIKMLENIFKHDR